MSIKNNYERVYGLSLINSTKESSEERLNDLTEALNKISRAAQSCGTSMQEMVAATNAFAQRGIDLSNAASSAIADINNATDKAPKYDTLKELSEYVSRKTEDEHFDLGIPRFNMDDYKVNIDESLFNFKPLEPMQVLQRMEEKKPKPNSTPAKIGAVIKLRRDTEENCAKSNLLLHEGEICLVQKSDGNYYAVIGDGESRILDCPHLTLY